MSGPSFSNAHNLIDFHNVNMLQGALKKESIVYSIHHSIDVETEKHQTLHHRPASWWSGNREQGLFDHQSDLNWIKKFSSL